MNSVTVNTRGNSKHRIIMAVNHFTKRFTTHLVTSKRPINPHQILSEVNSYLAALNFLLRGKNNGKADYILFQKFT